MSFVLVISPVYAETEAISFTVSNQSDFSVQFFKIIFGDVANVMLGQPIVITQPDTVLGEIMFRWNTFLHLICVIAVMWNGGMWLIQSSVGSSQQFDSFGLPIRFVLALVGCVPLPHGYSLVQMVNFYGTASSINITNELANIAYDRMNAGGSISQMGSALQTDELVENLFMSHVCLQLINNYEEELIINRINSGLSAGEDGRQYSEYNMSFGEDAWFGTYDEKECGSYTFKNLAGDEGFTNGVAEQNFTDAMFGAALDLDEKISATVALFIPNIWGDKKLEKSDSITGKENPAFAAMMQQMEDDLFLFKNTYREDVTQALQDYELERQEYVNENQAAVPSFTENFSARDIGWIALGGTYILQSLQAQDNLKFAKGNAMKTDSEINVSVYDIEDIQGAMQLSSQAAGIVSPTGSNNTEQVSKLQNDTSSMVASAATWFVSNGDDPIMSAMNYGHLLITIGEITLIGTLPLEALVSVLNAEVNEETLGPPLISPGDWKRTAIALPKTVLKRFVGALMALAYALILAGLVFAFYIPALPLMHWIGAALGAVIANVLNIILSPIHIIAHAFLDGHGVFGHHARQGYFLMFSAYLRIPLTVIGFIVVYPLMLGAGKLLILLYTPYVSSMTSEFTSGIITFIALTVLLATLLASVIERCSTVMHEITDSAMRMLGSGAENLSGGSIASSSNSRFSSDSSSLTSSVLESSKESNRAKIRKDATDDLDGQL